MNAEVKQMPQKLELHTTIIEGKILQVEQPENSDYRFYTFTLPAADEYEAPSTIQVSEPAKNRPFGRQGDLIRIKAKLGGYRRKSGSNTYVTNTLNFVEVL